MPYTDEQIEGLKSYDENTQREAIGRLSPEERADLAQSVQAYNERKAGKQPDAIQGFVSSGVPVGHAASVATGAAVGNGPVVQQRQPELDRFMQATKIPYGLGGPTGVETSDPTLLRPEAWQNEVKNFTLSNGKVTNIRGDRAVWLDPSKGDATKHGWYWWTNHGWQQAPMRPYGKEPEIGELAKNLPQVAWQQSKDIGHAVAATAGEFRENPAEASRNAAALGLDAASSLARQGAGLGLVVTYGMGKLTGLIPPDDRMDLWKSELDKRGMAKLSSAVGKYKEITDSALGAGVELIKGNDPSLSEEQQQQLKEVGETYAGKSGKMAGDLLPLLLPMGAAELAGAKAASKLTSFGSRLALRTTQGAVVSAPQAFKEYGEVKQNLMASGMDEEEATGEALRQSAKDYSVSAPAMGLLFSSRFGKVFLPTSAAKAGLNRVIRAGGVTTGQVAIGNIVNGRPVADNFMESFAQNIGWEMAHLYSDIKAGKRIHELQKEYPSLEAAKLAKQQEFAIYNADFLSHPTKESKANYDKVVTDLGILLRWGDRLKFEGKEQPNTEAEGAKTGSGIKTVARRTAKISETPTNTPEQPTQPTDAIAPQETAIAEQAKPTEVPNAIQEQGAGEMGAQPRGTEGVGEQAGGVRPSEQGVEPARAQVGPEVAKPEVLAQGEEGKVAYRFNYSPDAKSINSKEWFHGTGTEGLSERNLDVTQTKESGLLGQGVYLTDDPSIAKKYARTRGKRTGSENVYSADINISNAYDMERKPDGWLIKSLDDALGSAEHSEHGPNEYQKEFREWVEQNPDASAVEAYGEMSRLMSELSHGNRIPSYEVGEIIGDTFNSSLLREGYDAITHEGGKTLGGDRHQVVILLDPSNIYGLRGDGDNPVRRFEIKRQSQEGKVANHPEIPESSPKAVMARVATKLLKPVSGHIPDKIKDIKGLLPSGEDFTIPVSELSADPTRFQYKGRNETTGVNQINKETGASGALAGVKVWNKESAGTVSVWRDPADGKVYVVNGHNRYDLAQRLGVKRMKVRFIDANNAAEAKNVGAIQNIASGKGTAMDAATLFRDGGYKTEDLERIGIPTQKGVVTNGLALSDLSGQWFEAAKSDPDIERIAVETGKAGLSKEQQGMALQELHTILQKKGAEDISSPFWRDMLDRIKGSQVRTSAGGGLFGEEESYQSTLEQQTDLIRFIRSKLRTDKTVGNVLTGGRYEESVGKAATVNKEAAAGIKQNAVSNLGMFESMKHLAGVGDVINDYAYRLSQAHSNKEAESIRHEALSSVKDSIKEMQGGNKPVNLEAQGEEGKAANHPESSSVQKGEAGFISKEMLGMDPELYKAIYGIAIKKMGLPEGATPADIANHVMGKIKTLGNNVSETTAKILTQIKGITRDAASRLAQILHDNFSVHGERKNITLEEGGKNGAERGRPGNLEVSGRGKPTEDRPAEISESQEGRVARQARLDATDAGSPTLLGPNLSLIEHHSIERKAVKTPRLGYDAVFFHSPDGSIAVVADRDGKRAYVTGNVESNGDITIGELKGNKVKGVGTDLIQTLVKEANGRFPETRGKETKGYAEGSTEEGPEGIHRMFNRFKSTLWSEDHKVSVLSDDIADSQFKHVESVKPEDVKSQIRDFYAGDTNKHNRSDLYNNSDIWTSKTPEEVNDFLLKHSEAKLDVKDPKFLADTFGGQQVYERIIKKMGLPEDASMRQIGEFTMGKIKSLGNTVAETTNKILTRVAGIGREAASKLAEFLHGEWENFKKRNGEQGAVTFGDLKRNAKKLASKQLSEDVEAKIDPADRDKAENMARMGIYAGEGSKYWDAMDEPQRNALKKAEDTFISQTQKAIKDFDPVKRFGRVRKASAEYDRSRAVAKATQEYIGLRNDTLVELERRGDIKLDPVEKFNIHATQQLSQGLFTDVSKASLKAQRDYAMTLHRELARKSQGLDTATKHAAIDVLNESKKVDPIVAEEAYRFVDAVDAGLQADYQKLSKGARDYIDKFIKPLQQINNGLYQNGQDMIGGDKVKDITHMPHKFEGVVDEDGNLQPPSRGMQLYKMRGIKPGSSNEIARTVEAGTDPSGKRYILNLHGDERASVWKNGDRIATASKGKDAEGHDVWKFKDKGATGRTIELKSGRAAVDEIEHHTPFRYSHDPVVSLVDSVVGLSEASRAKAMIDALVTSNMIRPNYDAPKGWAKVELSNVQGMMAPPDIASVLNDYHRSLNRSVDNSEIARATKQLGRAFINLGFVNPLVHMPNVIAHGVTGRGVSPWFTPSGAKALLGGIETGLESMGDTATNRLIRKAHDRLMGAIGSNVDPFRDNTFRNLAGLSGRMMNLDPKRTLSLKLYNKMMGEAIESNPEVVNNLFSRYGIKSMDAVKATINDMSDKIWMVDNLVRSTLYLDAIHKAGVPIEHVSKGELTSRERAIAQKAIESVDREGYPDYDIPAVGKMGRLGAHMKNSPLWLFTRFHWNTVKLVKNDTVDALKTLNPKQWATPEGRKDIYRAADKVAAYVLMAGVVYPMMDMVYQQLTGLDEEGVEARRGGAFGFAHAVAGLGSGEQRALGKFMNHMFTPSLPFSVGMDLYNSATNPMSGEKIVQLAKLRKAGEDAGEGDLTGAAGGLGSFAMDPAEYALFRAFAPAGTVRQGMRDYKGGGQKDASDKARAVVAAMLMGKLKNPQAEIRTEQNYHRDLKKIAKEQNKD